MSGDPRARLAGCVRDIVPATHGVYALCDAAGRLRYVGKSVRLRRRLSDYLRGYGIDTEPRIGRLMADVRGFAWFETRSELLSLLLEDALIKLYRPPVNVKQQEFEENRYLELTGDAYPACRIVEHAEDFVGRDVHGPLRDRYFADDLRTVLQLALGLRVCETPDPVDRCLEHGIGRCLGPCRGTLTPAAYADRVAEARAFLRDGDDGVPDRLAERRDRAAAERRFEEAARLRDAHHLAHRYARRQAFARRFGAGRCEVRDGPGDAVVVFEKGALVSPRVVVTGRGESDPPIASGPEAFRPDLARRRAVAALHRAPDGDARHLADRARVVYGCAPREESDDLSPPP